MPPPKAPTMRKKLDTELKGAISKMLNEIMFDFDDNGGQVDY